MFSCEFCEIFKDNFFAEHLWTTDCFCQHKNLATIPIKTTLKEQASHSFVSKNIF